jgi:hypothetical protein
MGQPGTSVVQMLVPVDATGADLAFSVASTAADGLVYQPGATYPNGAHVSGNRFNSWTLLAAVARQMASVLGAGLLRVVLDNTFGDVVIPDGTYNFGARLHLVGNSTLSTEEVVTFGAVVFTGVVQLRLENISWDRTADDTNAGIFGSVQDVALIGSCSDESAPDMQPLLAWDDGTLPLVNVHDVCQLYGPGMFDTTAMGAGYVLTYVHDRAVLHAEDGIFLGDAFVASVVDASASVIGQTTLLGTQLGICAGVVISGEGNPNAVLAEAEDPGFMEAGALWFDGDQFGFYLHQGLGVWVPLILGATAAGGMIVVREDTPDPGGNVYASVGEALLGVIHASQSFDYASVIDIFFDVSESISGTTSWNVNRGFSSILAPILLRLWGSPKDALFGSLPQLTFEGVSTQGLPQLMQSLEVHDVHYVVSFTSDTTIAWTNASSTDTGQAITHYGYAYAQSTSGRLAQFDASVSSSPSPIVAFYDSSGCDSLAGAAVFQMNYTASEGTPVPLHVDCYDGVQMDPGAFLGLGTSKVGFSFYSPANDFYGTALNLTYQSVRKPWVRSGDERPDNPVQGEPWFDTALTPKIPIWWNGSAWVDATGAGV